MEAQTPAQGVVKVNDWGDSKMYQVVCDCMSDSCVHTVDVEADDMHVSVSVYLKAHTKWTEKSRWRQIWEILTKGYAEVETTIVMKEQTALNYAETLKSAVNDVKEFKSKR